MLICPFLSLIGSHRSRGHLSPLFAVTVPALLKIFGNRLDIFFKTGEKTIHFPLTNVFIQTSLLSLTETLCLPGLEQTGRQSLDVTPNGAALGWCLVSVATAGPWGLPSPPHSFSALNLSALKTRWRSMGPCETRHPGGTKRLRLPSFLPGAWPHPPWSPKPMSNTPGISIVLGNSVAF